MEYRKLPKGNENIGIIGLGLGNIHTSSEAVVEETVRYAVEQNVNLYDLCCGTIGTFQAFGRAIRGSRETIYTQMHFGATYPRDRYEFSRNDDEMKRSFDKVLNAIGTDYTDFGFVHCIDEDADLRHVLRTGGIFDYMVRLKEQGVIRHLGCSSHTVHIARAFLDTDEIDSLMFSINPVYDYTGTGYGETGNALERMAFYREAEAKGVGIVVMKPFAGGQLLDARRSPLGVGLSHAQCFQYALDKPGVVCVLPGVGNVDDVKTALTYFDTAEDERDYAEIGSAVPKDLNGRCVYCNHCAPCPQGIDIGLVNKYYDLAMLGDDLAKAHYENLSVRADACVGCGHCDGRCPFGVLQSERMREIAAFFG